MKYGSLNTVNDILYISPRQKKKYHKHMYIGLGYSKSVKLYQCKCLFIFFFVGLFIIFVEYKIILLG